MPELWLAERWGVFQEGRFMGRVLDEWINDAQELVRVKLPHILVIALIAFLLNKVLRVVTNRMVHVAERHSAHKIQVAQVRTLAGVIRATGLAIIALI